MLHQQGSPPLPAPVRWLVPIGSLWQRQYLKELCSETRSRSPFLVLVSDHPPLPWHNHPPLTSPQHFQAGAIFLLGTLPTPSLSRRQATTWLQQRSFPILTHVGRDPPPGSDCPTNSSLLPGQVTLSLAPGVTSQPIPGSNIFTRHHRLSCGRCWWHTDEAPKQSNCM